MPGQGGAGPIIPGATGPVVKRRSTPAPAAPATSGGGSTGGSFGTAPRTVGSGPGGYGSADAADRAVNAPGKTYNGPSVANAGDLYDVLNLPETGKDESFILSFDDSAAITQFYGHPQIVQMSVAQGVSWLRSLSITDKDAYNSLVLSLAEAGYLAKASIKLNSFTQTVAQAFYNAARDVAAINQQAAGPDGSPYNGGQVTTLLDHLDALAAGADESGFGGLGSKTPAAAQGPVRQDQLLDQETLTSAIQSNAQDLLGRVLTDEELGHVSEAFRGTERQWNDAVWAAQQAAANGQPSSVTDRPNAQLVSKDDVEEQFKPQVARERAGDYFRALGSILGVG